MSKSPRNTALRRRQLARDLEKKHRRQLELLAEMAAVYHAEGKEPPKEIAAAIGAAIGAVEHRRRAFLQVKKVLIEQTSGIGVKKIVERFFEDIKDDNATIMAALSKAVKG